MLWKVFRHSFKQICMNYNSFLITVAARSKPLTVFAHSNIRIVGLNLTWSMDVCVHLFCVCAVLCPQVVAL
jgi:hypothetical protein